jgi:hypothetical protein
MDENWYAVEQEIHDRLTEARAAARIRSLTRGRQPAAPRPYCAAVIRLARRVWVRGNGVASHALTRRGHRASGDQARLSGS